MAKETADNPPTLNELHNDRKRGNITELTIQTDAINAVIDFMGSDLWYYMKGSSTKYPRRAELLIKAG